MNLQFFGVKDLCVGKVQDITSERGVNYSCPCRTLTVEDRDGTHSIDFFGVEQSGKCLLINTPYVEEVRSRNKEIELAEQLAHATRVLEELRDIFPATVARVERRWKNS